LIVNRLNTKKVQNITNDEVIIENVANFRSSSNVHGSVENKLYKLLKNIQILLNLDEDYHTRNDKCRKEMSR
jgi:hypothetical protein